MAHDTKGRGSLGFARHLNNICSAPQETTRSRDNLIVNKGEDASVRSSRKSSGTRSAIVLADCRPIEIIKMRQFWCFWIGFLCNIQGINYCTLMWKVRSVAFHSLNNVYCIIYTAYCIVHTIHCILYNV